MDSDPKRNAGGSELAAPKIPLQCWAQPVTDLVWAIRPNAAPNFWTDWTTPPTALPGDPKNAKAGKSEQKGKTATSSSGEKSLTEEVD